MMYYFSCSQIEAWLSLVERCVRDAEVAGSNPVASTIDGDLFSLRFCMEKQEILWNHMRF